MKTTTQIDALIQEANPSTRKGYQELTDLESVYKSLTERFLTDIPPVLTEQQVRALLEVPTGIEEPVMEEFAVPAPTMEDVKLALAEEAQQVVRTLLFWKKAQKVEEYAAQMLEQRYDESFSRWIATKEAFERSQQEQVVTYREKRRREEELRRTRVLHWVTGDTDYVLKEAQERFDELLPDSWFLSLDYDQSAHTICSVLRVPQEHLPSKGRSRQDSLERGAYLRLLSCSVYRLACELFTISGNIRTLCFDVEEPQGCVLSMRLDRSQMLSRVFDLEDVLSFISDHRSHIEVTKTGILHPVVSLSS